MKFKKQSSGVYVATGLFTVVSSDDLDMLRSQIPGSPRNRTRICAHRRPGDRVQEMMIVLPRDGYVRPHKHTDKTESMTVLSGSADVVLFDNSGKVTDVFRVGPAGGKGVFYYRMDKPIYHTLFVRSPFFAFHEAASGPFRRSGSVPAKWAPPEEDIKEGQKFLNKAISEFKRGSRRRR